MTGLYREEQLEQGQPSPWDGEFMVGAGYDSKEDTVTGRD